MPIPVLIDGDPGYDDVIAIMLALASPEVEVLGITTVDGNQPVAETTENALRVVEFLARKIPVDAACSGSADQGTDHVQSRISSMSSPCALMYSMRGELVAELLARGRRLRRQPRHPIEDAPDEMQAVQFVEHGTVLDS